MRVPADRRLAWVALLLVGALVCLAWWTVRREGAVSEPTLTAAVAPPETTDVELAAPRAPDAETRASSARVPSPDASPPADPLAGKSTGEITGSLRSKLETLAVEGGSVLLFLPPLDPSLPRDRAAESARSTSKTSVGIAADGSFRIPRVQPGAWRLKIRATEFEPHEALVEVEAGRIAHVDVEVVPLWTAALVVDLRHPNGLPLRNTLDGPDRELFKRLRPVLLEQCPVVGATLPENARELTQKNVDVRADHSMPWLKALLEKPTRGCACVVLGERVLDAVHFVEGQETVDLTAAPEALRAQLAACDVHVSDDLSGAPLSTAWVKFTQKKRSHRVRPDKLGRAHTANLLAGEVDIKVSHEGYADFHRTQTLLPGGRAQVDVVLLPRNCSIRGTVSFPNAEERKVSVYLYRVLSDGADYESDRTASCDSADFTFSELPRGDYLVGLRSEPRAPDPARVKNNELEGWTWVHLDSAGEGSARLVLTEELWPRVRKQMSSRGRH